MKTSPPCPRTRVFYRTRVALPYPHLKARTLLSITRLGCRNLPALPVSCLDRSALMGNLVDYQVVRLAVVLATLASEGRGSGAQRHDRAM